MTRLGRSKRRDSGFQWLIIGIVLGMGCSFSFGLALYVFDVIQVSTTNDPTATVAVAQETIQIENTETGITEEPDNNQIDENTQQTPDDTNGTDDGQSTEPTQNAAPPSPDANNTTPTPLPGGENVSESGTGLSTENPSTPVTPPVDDPTAIALSSGDQIPEQLSFVVSTLVEVGGGTFRMGTTQDEGQAAVAECSTRDGGNCPASDVADSIPPHDVTISPFRIEQFEVSVSQYVAFLNYIAEQNPGTIRPHLTECNGPCILARGDLGGEFSDIIYNEETQRYSVAPAGIDRSNFPMTFVMWEGAQSYCRTIGRELPTEAQWERAARGPNNYIYPWGQQWDPTAANTRRSGEDRTGLGGTVQVDTYPTGQSDYGPFNMAGNVAEWTRDWYSASIYQERANSGQTITDPTGAGFGEERVVRGGSWDAVPLYSRTVHRRSESPGTPGPWLGFRCVDDPDPFAAPINSSTSNTAPADTSIPQTTLDPNQ